VSRKDKGTIRPMRFILILLAVVGGFVLFGMLVAPYEPRVRDWYINNACPLLDRVSTDICAAARREAGTKATIDDLRRRTRLRSA
jgi:hypothetical protein